MAYQKYSEIKVGIFVLIAFVIVIVTIFWAKDFLIKRGLNDYVVFFPSVNNLNVGDPVTVKGIKMGKIDEMELVGDSVKIDFSLDNSVKIRQDYAIEVALGELTGGNVLYINPGISTVEVDHNKPLRGTPSTTFSDIMKSVTTITSDVKGLIAKFGTNSDKLNEVLVSVNELVNDPQMKRDLKSTISNFEVSSRNLNALVSENRVNLNSITGKVGNAVDNVNDLVDNTSPEFKKTFEHIQSMTNTVDSLVTNLNEIVGGIKDQKGTVGKLIYDESFFRNMNKTLEEVERLTRSIRKEGVKINLF